MKAKAKNPISQGEELANYQQKRREQCNLLNKLHEIFPDQLDEQNELFNQIMLVWERDYWQSIVHKSDLPGVK